MTGYIYLASPYTAYLPDGSFDEPKMAERYDAVMRATTHLAISGFTIYSPIAMSHSMDQYLGRMAPEFWYEFDLPMLENAEALFVLKLKGWEKSEGVTREVTFAGRASLPILFLRPTRIKITVDK